MINTTDPILFIIRGVPGSGKSSLASCLCDSNNICEADKFFYDVEGNYKFDAVKLPEAHEWCRSEVEKRMQSKSPRIVVSNTFSREWEMATYVRLAEEYNYKFFSIVTENRHGNSNVHGAPEEIVEKMRERFEIKL
jgi:predicted kinase